MDYEILNDGKPNADGNLEAVVRNRAGQIVSRYLGRTENELLRTVLESNVQANRQIGRLMQPDQGRETLAVNPRELTDEESFRLSAQLDDPDPKKRLAAVQEITDIRLGGAAPKVAQAVKGMSDEQAQAFYFNEGQIFVQEHPEYYPHVTNGEKIAAEVARRGLMPTRNNIEMAYNELLETGELLMWPEGDQAPPPSPASPPAVTVAAAAAPTEGQPRPRNIRSISSGIRNGDANGTPPKPPAPKTISKSDLAKEIATMSRAEYMHRLRTDPEFKRQVDATG
jgi:hypothetical protein